MDFNNIRYCKRCGRIYSRISGKMCPECTVQTDKDFIVCREYIDNNSNVTIEELSENTGISEKIILMLLKEGRLVLGSGSELFCELCGKAIGSGRFCPDCFADIQKDINSVKSSLSKSVSDGKVTRNTSRRDRMHTASNSKDYKEIES